MPPLRRLTAVLDALTLFCAAGAIALAVFGAVREFVAGFTVSIRWSHAAFAAAVLGTLRHVLQPAPSLAATLSAIRGRLGRRPALRDAMLAFWLTRPVVLLIGLLAVTAIGPAPAAGDVSGRDPVASLPLRFDAGWYAGIAYDGYEWQRRFDRQQNLAFFPAYPMLIRAVGVLAGRRADASREEWVRRYAWAGVAISLAAFFWAAWYLSRTAHELLDDERATAAVVLLAAYPFALFYSAAYTEALFLLAALGAWYHFRRAQWARAAAWGLLAGLSRPNGCFLTLALGLLALGVRDAAPAPGLRQRGRAPLAALVVAATPVVGMLIFTVYVYWLTEIWFAWARMHGAWGRSFGSDGLTVPVAAGLLQLAAAHPFQALNTLGLAFALALAWPVWRKLGPAWAAFVLLNVLAPLATGGVLSMGRVTATLFPLFLALAAVLSSRAAAGWAAMFALVQGLAAALFFTWRELF